MLREAAEQESGSWLVVPQCEESGSKHIVDAASAQTWKVDPGPSSRNARKVDPNTSYHRPGMAGKVDPGMPMR